MTSMFINKKHRYYEAKHFQNAVTKGFSRPTSHPVQGWMGNNKAFCSHGTRDGRRVIKVHSIKW